MHERYGSPGRREREAMALVACGLMNKRVGWELGITVVTVNAHRGRVTRKMKARSHSANGAQQRGLPAMAPASISALLLAATRPAPCVRPSALPVNTR